LSRLESGTSGDLSSICILERGHRTAPSFRRTLLLAIAGTLVSCLLAGSGTAAISTNKRVETKRYVLPSIAGIDVGPVALGSIHYFRRQAEDRFFRVELADASGMSVPATIYQYRRCCDDIAQQETFDRRDICGRMAGRVKLSPETVRISVATRIPTDGCASGVSSATVGTISLTFSR
jgi:hypothetical protein